VYVNYNSARLLLESVDSLRTHDRAESLVRGIVVVDNASRAEDAAWLDRLPDSVHLIRADRNLGFVGEFELFRHILIINFGLDDPAPVRIKVPDLPCESAGSSPGHVAVVPLYGYSSRSI